MKIIETAVTLSDIRFYAYHGALPAEKIIGGDYLVTLTLYFPASSAMESDELSDTVNYAEVYEVLKKEMDLPSKLLEHVVGRILTALGSSFPILTKADCTLTKVTPPIPSFQSSGVSFSATALYR